MEFSPLDPTAVAPTSKKVVLKQFQIPQGFPW
jgi:hypothetical protein